MLDSNAEEKVSPGNEPDPSHAESGLEEHANVPGEAPQREIGGPQGPEPTRYGDWERNGRCTDF
jgi:hypothetical protein